MSTQKGNDKRTRRQKYQNRSVFRNTLHDSSKRTKDINELEITEVCQQCKDVISWKIKYKKYKFLSQPKTCLQCHQKAIKFAYHTLCGPCGKEQGVCCKCRQLKHVVLAAPTPKARQNLLLQLDSEIKLLSERKRRTFYRYLDELDGTRKAKNRRRKTTKDANSVEYEEIEDTSTQDNDNEIPEEEIGVCEGTKESMSKEEVEGTKESMSKEVEGTNELMNKEVEGTKESMSREVEGTKESVSKEEVEGTNEDKVCGKEKDRGRVVDLETYVEKVRLKLAELGKGLFDVGSNDDDGDSSCSSDSE